MVECGQKIVVDRPAHAVPREQLLLLPLLCKVERGADETLDGVACRVLRATPQPQAIEALKQRGIGQLDLGGVNTARSAGIARFKLGTGGQPVILAGTYL